MIIKQILTCVLLSLSGLTFTQTQQDFFLKANDFFKTYVEKNKVDYQSIKLNGVLQLDELVNYIAVQPYEIKSEKAYLINAYNILVIKKIIDHYPVKSPQAIPGFFENKDVIVNHQLYSLNQIENDLLRKTYNDARLHFALVCGAVSCPPITNFAYMPNQLEVQLNQQTKKAVVNPAIVKQDDEEKAIYISEIFKWYETDFGIQKDAIIEFINRYRPTPVPLNYRIKYIPYDWTLNDVKLDDVTADNLKTIGGQTYTAGSLLGKGQIDLTMFNTLYTQTKSNWQGVNHSGLRETFNTHLVQFTYGISENKRLNLGFDINFKSSGSSQDTTFKGVKAAFTYKNTATSRVGITSFGVRAKWQPFKKVQNFSVQSTLSAPTITSPEGNSNLYWADWARITWWNQLFYTKTFKKFQLFAELDALFRLKIFSNQTNALDLPMSLFFSYFPTSKITFYVMSQHVPRLVQPSSTDWLIPANYTASGVGFKYQFNTHLNAELLYTNFWRAKNNGLGQTFNLGLKYIH